MMDIALDEVLHFDAVTSDSTGAASDADSTPTWAIFEEATDTPILAAQNFTKRTSLTGEYRGSATLSAANGFEAGKWYHVKGYATVDSVAGKAIVFGPFRVVPAENTAGIPVVDIGYVAGEAASAALPADELADTTIATLASQTSFTLTAGSADDDAYNGCMAVLIDQSTSAQRARCTISDYTGSTKTVTLAAAPEFTISTGDTVKVVAIPKQLTGHTPQTADHTANIGDIKAKTDQFAFGTANRVNAQVYGAEADAIDAGSVKADAVTKIQSGLATGTAQATAQSDLDIITGTDGVTLATAQGNYSPAQAGDEMDLVDAPNATAVTAIATAMEAAILDEGDATALLQAIAAKVEEFLVNEGDATATIAAIATAVNTAITTAHGSGSYERNTEPLDAAGTRTALGMATDNLDSQLAAVAKNAQLEAVQKIVEADVVIDTNTTPWQVVWLERGTGAIGAGTELLRKNLSDVSGGDITATTTVIGGALEQ